MDKNKIESNKYEMSQQDLKEQDIDNVLVNDIITPFLKELDNLESPYKYINKKLIMNDNDIINNKKRKIKKMKNYNKRKGDWQCKNCGNINFHFRTICNICDRNKE